MGLVLRQGSSGQIFAGNADGDFLVWNAAEGEWESGAGGAALPPGDFEGQLLYWDGAAYVPVPAGVGPVVRTDGFTSVDPSPTSINLGVGGASVVGVTAQLNDNLSVSFVLATNDRFQASYADGVAPLVRVVGDATGLLFEAGGSMLFGPAGVNINALIGTELLLQLDGIPNVRIDATGVNIEGATAARLAANGGVDSLIVGGAAGLVGVVVGDIDLFSGANAALRATATATVEGASVNLLATLVQVGGPTCTELGFYDAAPVTRPSIVGNTVQSQIDSIVAALVSLGLATDNRTVTAAQSQIGWAPTAAAQQSNLLTLLPAGHPAGFYLVGIEQWVATVSAASYGIETFTWSNGGAKSTATLNTATQSASWATLGLSVNGSAGGAVRTQQPRVIFSDGIDAITARVTAQGAIVTPVIDIYASAFCIGT